MREGAPTLLLALEGSGLGAAIRQSVWAYPAANVGHVVALVLFAGAVAVMDLTLLGAFGPRGAARIGLPARRCAVAAFLVLLATGFALFTAEASHVALNPVFQIKMLLVAAGIVNALAVGPALSRATAATGEDSPMPLRVRLAAVISLTIWLAVAACGRLIAYL